MKHFVTRFVIALLLFVAASALGSEPSPTPSETMFGRAKTRMVEQKQRVETAVGEAKAAALEAKDKLQEATIGALHGQVKRLEDAATKQLRQLKYAGLGLGLLIGATLIALVTAVLRGNKLKHRIESLEQSLDNERHLLRTETLRVSALEERLGIKH